MAPSDSTFGDCQQAIRIHIVRRTGARDVGHPFLGHSWSTTDSDQGIAWGVRASPSIQKLLGVIKAQRVEPAIKTPRYLIDATGDDSCALRLLPAAPLPIRDLIFRNKDDDIRAWLLANDGRLPLDLMVLESSPDLQEDGTPTPEPADRRYRYFDRKVWDSSRQVRENLGSQEQEDDDDDDDYDQDGGGRGRGEESSSDDVEPDDEGESDEDDESDESDEDDELKEVSRMPGKDSATRIDNVSPKLQVNMMI